MKTYEVTLTGVTPLLMHNDDIAWAEFMKKWQKDPTNKQKSVAGDDRSPAWTWLGYMYHDNGLVCIPSDNLQTVIREGGAKVPTGKRNQTYKKLTASMMVVNETSWPLVFGPHDGPTAYDPIRKAALDASDTEFVDQIDLAEQHGFALFAKRAKVGQSKHVRVRPRFDAWECTGTVTVLDDEQITKDILLAIFGAAGRECGLGDWRPSAPKSPGPYGKFDVAVSYKAISKVDCQTLYAFYMARRGAFQGFYIYDLSLLQSLSWAHTALYVGTADGSTTIFDLPGRSTSSQAIYVNGTAQSSGTDYSILTGGGSASADRVSFVAAPTSGDVISCDFTGFARLPVRFSQDRMPYELWEYQYYRTGSIKLTGLSFYETI